jgi:flagellar biosynthetic protein FlhB
MADSAQDKKLPASERRILKARSEGQVARSRDLGHFAILAAGVSLVAYAAVDVIAGVAALLKTGLRFDAQLLAQPGSMLGRLAELSLHMMGLLLPLALLIWLLAAACGVLSGGWNFTMQPVQPNFTKLNPLTGLGRIFSGDQMVDTLKSCLLALVLATVGALAMRAQWGEYAQLLSMPLPAALPKAGDLVLTGLLPVGAVLGVFALVDVPLQRYRLLQRLRMSVQEVKQEMKEVEGNSQVKQQMRARMREMANRRMMAKVPAADLVVMNPSHYAVALKYDEATMSAPRVVAKGADLVALRIRDLAREHGVPVLQAPPLARALYAHTELDAEVPARLFAAVAQVLAWVYQLREAMASGRAAAVATPTPDVPPDLDPANSGDTPPRQPPTARPGGPAAPAQDA